MSGVTNVVKVEGKRTIVGPSSHVNIAVTSNGYGDTDVTFRVKRNAKLGKLIKAYGEAKNIDIKTIKFLYDGIQIKPDYTPDQLDREEEGEDIEIQVVQDMLAGG
ncbi:hypothetical protein MKW98_021617 [Papaver atlanticum]|uniref:Rad60/SUMO-like domain-containing protein n=1 Tax=Papaver atlanticum TaxID=357466 RepID=A0AAD4TC99_9MAGN|nr:hypothetical protein MKW98_021617 [Papaver atlanticum]